MSNSTDPFSSTNRGFKSETEAFDWLAEVFEEPSGSLDRKTARDDIMNWDSIGMLTLMAEMDRQFGVTLSETELRDLATVGDVLTILESRALLPKSS